MNLVKDKDNFVNITFKYNVYKAGCFISQELYLFIYENNCKYTDTNLLIFWRKCMSSCRIYKGLSEALRNTH